MGRVTVIPKKGNTLYLDNIRPITETNLFIKIYEKILNKKITNYLEENNIIHENQGGFRKKSFNYKYCTNFNRFSF